VSEDRYTSREAAQISGVPFFTVDYWDRSGFLRPTVSPGGGRGRGRERVYSYADILRLRIARELRDEEVSFQTLRHVVDKLRRHGAELAGSRFVLVGRSVHMAQSSKDVARILESSSKRKTFAVLVDLTDLTRTTATRARRVLAMRSGRAREVAMRLKSACAVALAWGWAAAL
jgi:DNA-binding transcriptional MerR regulator